MPVTVDGDLVVDRRRREVLLRGETRWRSPPASSTWPASFLVARPGEAFAREDLLQQVWGWSFGDHSTVTVHVRRLREKVESEPRTPRRLVTVWGVGYRWEPSPPAPVIEEEP